MSKLKRRALIVTLWALMILLLGACGSQGVESAQVVSVTPTSIATTAPVFVPTPTPRPALIPNTQPEVTPTSAAAPTALPSPTLEPAPNPTEAADGAQASIAAAADDAEVVETPTPIAVPTVEESETEESETGEDASPEPEPEPEPESGSASTPAPETPTAVVAASGEPPLECYDPEVQLYRAFVDGVDALSFEGGRVSCTGAGTNAVSAARSYRHSSGLIVHRNADFIFNDAGTAYIPYSGSVHFCMNGRPASAPFRADTVPALLVVIDNEAQRQLGQGAIGPAAFTSSGSQC